MILVLDDVNGQFEKPFLYSHDVAFGLGCPKKMEKCEKIKDSKNHSSKTIDRTEFCLASSERGD